MRTDNRINFQQQSVLNATAIAHPRSPLAGDHLARRAQTGSSRAVRKPPERLTCASPAPRSECCLRLKELMVDRKKLMVNRTGQWSLSWPFWQTIPARPGAVLIFNQGACAMLLA